MGLARFVLIVTGLSFTGYGIWCGVDPRGVVGQFTGFGLDQPAGMVEAIAMYGGLQTGVGLFLLWAGVRREWTVPALVMIAFMMGALALTRALGMSLHGVVGAHPGAAVYEAITTLFALAALYRLRRTGPVGALA
jgi:hypothetical protein